MRRTMASCKEGVHATAAPNTPRRTASVARIRIRRRIDVGLAGRSGLETALLEPPAQQVDAVLSKEGLLLEDHRRHAPVACVVECLLVGLDDVIVVLRVCGDLGVQRGKIQAGACGGLG